MKIRETWINFRIQPSYLLGIDIRRNFIRLVGLSYHKSKYQLEASVHTVAEDKEVSDEKVGAMVEELLQQITVKTTDVAVAVAHSVVISKEVKVDTGLSDTETLDFLRFNLKEQIGDPSGEISFDYYPLKIEAEKDSGWRQLKLVAVRQGLVARWVKLLQTVNLNPKIIDVDVYALERAARRQLNIVMGLVAIINIDYGDILMVVIDHEKIVYVHEDYVGIENLSSKIRIVEQIELKLRMIYSVLSQPLGKIVLGGERVAISGLAAEINSKLNIQTIIANPFLDMELSSAVTPKLVQQIAPQMLISCGLALRVMPPNITMV